jgi:FkbM family methyltransferase
MGSACTRWICSISDEIKFYKSAFFYSRKDKDFDWTWNYSNESIKTKIKRRLTSFDEIYTSVIGECRPYSVQWIRNHVDDLWKTRLLLEDEFSRLMFDNYLVLSSCTYSNYFTKKIYADDLLVINSNNKFLHNLPKDYCGSPLREFSVNVLNGGDEEQVQLITTSLQIDLTNRYRQYFAKWDGLDFSPRLSDVVFDCGACIGDISTIFAALVKQHGKVYMFDPVPLHIKYCDLHKKLNPNLAEILHSVCVAVSDENKTMSGSVSDLTNISPGGFNLNACEFVRLDDFVKKNEISKVDYIKMDIEGYECTALLGARSIIQKFKPRLAICGYHRPQDLWEIPSLVKSFNESYKVYFSHHSPKRYESVFYFV